MEKIENKTFLGDKELTWVAERFPAKFYKYENRVFITVYDEVLAEIEVDNIYIEPEILIENNK